ncbi:MAG: precorrin-6A synthase (deacetylating) [Methyloligellaceae bacterium]
MAELFLIGMGTGNPEHLTLEAVRYLNQADLILIPVKGEDKSRLAEIRRQICFELVDNADSKIVEIDLPVRDKNIPDYKERVDKWHDEIADIWLNAISRKPDAEKIALLVWGDPSLYDSTIRIAERARAKLDLNIHVIAGITSIQALTAAHKITLNEVAEPFIVTTGRQLRDTGWSDQINTVIVMLDGDCSFEGLLGEELHIWWGAYLGMKEEIIINGPLDEVCKNIKDQRENARSRYGWIMDTYMLRKTSI